jgi:hypothetical protein
VVPELLALLPILKRKHNVVARDHSYVAMARFGGVDEVGRGARTGERGRDLRADVARLTHAHDDDTALAVEDQAAGLHETRIDALLQRRDRLALQGKCRQCGLDQSVGAHGNGLEKGTAVYCKWNSMKTPQCGHDFA